MKKIRYIALGTALAALPMMAQAQKQAKDSTVNRTVIVEQEYNPDILDASKINLLPKVEPPTVSKKEVEYDATLAPAGNIPATTMQPYTGKETQNKALPGYARLGYGTYGNLDAQANYLFVLSNSDRLNLNFRMDGMDGKLTLPQEEMKWNSYYYRTHAALDYVHAFRKADLKVAAHFDLSNFNFLPGSYSNKQKFTAGDVHFGVKSTSDDLPFQFRAETNLMMYQRQHEIGFDDAQESIVRTLAQVSASINEEQLIALSLGMDNVFYNGNKLTDYTSIKFNPHYTYQNEEWKIRLGAQADLAFGFGKQLRVSPDLWAQYTFSDSYILYAQAKGGRLQNDFRRLEALTPYGQLISQPDATYEQLNAALGFKASPLSGLWFNLYGGYQDLKNDLLPWGTTYSHTEPNRVMHSGYLLQFNAAHTNNAYAGAEVSYDYKDIIALKASGVYRNWETSSKQSTPLLAFKPAFEANFHVDVRPIPALLINVGYQHTSRTKVEDTQIDPISNLYLGGSYELFKGFSVYARANNLLNNNYQLYWGYPAQGVSFMGGVSLRF